MPLPEPSQADVDAKYARLTTVMRELESRLRALGHESWAKWVGDSLAQIEARDSQGLVHFRYAFGTMGSINDLGLGPDDDRLLSEAYDLAQWFGRQLRAEDDAFDWPW